MTVPLPPHWPLPQTHKSFRAGAEIESRVHMSSRAVVRRLITGRKCHAGCGAVNQ